MVRNKKVQFPSFWVNDVFLFSFSVHTTHFLQPLHIGIYQLLKRYWSQMLNANIKENLKEQPNKTKFYLTLNSSFKYNFSIKIEYL